MHGGGAALVERPQIGGVESALGADDQRRHPPAAPAPRSRIGAASALITHARIACLRAALRSASRSGRIGCTSGGAARPASCAASRAIVRQRSSRWMTREGSGRDTVRCVSTGRIVAAPASVSASTVASIACAGTAWSTCTARRGSPSTGLLQTIAPADARRRHLVELARPCSMLPSSTMTMVSPAPARERARKMVRVLRPSGLRGRPRPGRVSTKNRGTAACMVRHPPSRYGGRVAEERLTARTADGVGLSVSWSTATATRSC